MKRLLWFAAFALLPLGLRADEAAPEARPWFIHLGVDRADPAAAFAPMFEAGVPVLQWGLTCLGVFGGGTQWRRGSFAIGSLNPGDLLDKTTYWAGAYWGGEFWTFGLDGEYAQQDVYATPSAANSFVDGVARNRSGAGAFTALHWRNGLGAFVRAGTQSGFGCGLSYQF